MLYSANRLHLSGSFLMRLLRDSILANFPAASLPHTILMSHLFDKWEGSPYWAQCTTLSAWISCVPTLIQLKYTFQRAGRESLGHHPTKQIQEVKVSLFLISLHLHSLDLHSWAWIRLWMHSHKPECMDSALINILGLVHCLSKLKLTCWPSCAQKTADCHHQCNWDF